MADEERRLIEAIFDGDLDTIKVLAHTLGNERAHHVMLGAFTLAVHRQFPGDYTPEQVTAFVADLRRRMEEGDALKPMPTEALIRSSLDEPELRRDLDTDDVYRGYAAITYAYGKDHRIHGVERDDFIREVLEAVS